MKLVSSRPFWPIRDGLPSVHPPLEHDARTDVAIVGGGITGALLAQEFTDAGHRVIVLDRRDVASGSTSASTALLTWEIDVPIAALARLEGRPNAQRIYRLCAEAVDDLARKARRCGEKSFTRTSSLYLAASARHVRALQQEGRDRRRIGLVARDVKRAELRRLYGIERPWALLSEGCARVDPYSFAHRLLEQSTGKGAHVYDRTRVTSIRRAGDGWELGTDRHTKVRARNVVIATGFEAQRFLRRPRLLHLHSTYAMVTEPYDDAARVKELPMVWETARPYTYVRPLSDGRLMVGGADERLVDASRRDRLVARKAGILRRRLRTMVPGKDAEVAFAWGGTFGDTTDGLAYIGAPVGRPGPLYALGYGANGIVFASVAARLLLGLVEGRPSRDLELFAFNRRAVSGRRCPSCAPWSGYVNGNALRAET